MASRSLNVVIAADNRTGRAFNDAGRDADNLGRKFQTLNFATASLGGEMGGLSLRVGSFAGSIGSMAPVLAAAVPALGAVAAAAVSLGSSLAAAGAGAGALGAGLAASLAPIAIVGKQVTSRFEEIKKAQEALNKAQQDGTVESRKAADAALADLSRNERAMVSALGKLSGLQDRVLGGASDRVFGGLAKAIDVLAPKLEKLAGPFDRLGDAMSGNIERVAKLLASGPWQDAFGKFIDSATGLVRPITTVFLRVGNIIRDVAVEALPYVQEAVRGLARTFSDLDEKATRAKIGEVVATLVEHTKSWFNLFREVGGLVGQVFGSAAGQGKSFVDTMAGAVSAVSDFVGQMRSGEGTGGKFVAGIRTAFESVRDAVNFARDAVTTWVAKNRDDIDSVIDAFRDVGRFAKRVFEDTLVPIIQNSIDAVKPIVTGLASTIRGLVRLVSGLLSGDWDKAWSGAKEAVRGAFRVIRSAVTTALSNLGEVIADFGPKIIKGIVRGLANMGKALAEGLFDGIKWAAARLPGMAADALKGLGSAIGKQITGAIGSIFGDGLGKSIGDGVGRMKDAFPAFGGGLMGARPNMAPVAGAAARFGLGVSSGRRPGAITSSGNQSYHSTGEALDIAGSPAGMLGFFRFMKNTMGPRLAELIYTPGGTGVRNGSPHTYSGAVAADHFDHVHVAIDSGAPGVGDGYGNLRNGPKGPMSFNAVARIAEGVGLPGVTFAQLAQGESGLDPDNVGHDSGGTKGLGLWQITTGFNDDVIAKYGGVQAMFDPRKNALAARDIFRRQGKGAWYGTGFVKGWNLHYGGGGGSSSSGGSGGKSRSGVASGGPSGNVTPAFYAGPEAPSDEQQRVIDYINRRGNPLVPGARPAKGGGPTKGFTPAEVEAGINTPDRPSELDWLDLALANAEATADTGDDRSALGALREYRARALAGATASGDPRAIAQARRDLTSAENALKSLEDAIKANTEQLNGVRADLEKQRADNLQRELTVSQSQYGILADAITGVVATRMGSTLGLGLSGMRTPAGSVSRA